MDRDYAGSGAMSLASTQPPLVSYSSHVNDYMDHPAPNDPRNFDMAWGMPEFVDGNMQMPDLRPNEYAEPCGPPSYPPYDSSLLAGTASWSSSTPTDASETTNTRHYSQYGMPAYISSPTSHSDSVHSLSHADATTSARMGWSPNALPNLAWDEAADDLARTRSNAATPLATYPYPDELLSTMQRPPSTTFSASAPEAQQRIVNARSRSQTLSDTSDSIHVASGSSDSFIFMPHGGDRRGLHPPDVWEAYKEVIRGLYLAERRPLKEVVQIMEDMYGFAATPKMYKTKFTTWGFAKNNTEKEAKQILYYKLMRDAQGKRSVFSRHGKEIDLQRYLRRKGVSEMDLVDFDADGTLPPHVRCWTPVS